MFCCKCGVQIPDASAFCNKCGAPQAGAPPAPAPAAAAASKDEPEQAIWRGRYSAKAAGHMWILWGLWAVGLAVLRHFGLRGRVEQPWLSYVDLGLLALVALPMLYIAGLIVARKLSIRYRLSTHRLFRETGIISRHVNEVELIRVDDVSVRQNILQRIFDVGVVTVISSDATEPRLELIGIRNPIEVKEKIRTHVRQRRSRALHMESL